MYFCRKILGTTRGSKLRNEDFSAATSSVLLSKGNLCRSPRFFSSALGLGPGWSKVSRGQNGRWCPQVCVGTESTPLWAWVTGLGGHLLTFYSPDTSLESTLLLAWLHAAYIYVGPYQFSSVQLLIRVRLFATPWITSQTLGVYPNTCPLSWWCHPALSSSVVPFSSLYLFLKNWNNVFYCDCLFYSIMNQDPFVSLSINVAQTFNSCVAFCTMNEP